MSADATFAQFVQRIRAGDETAAAELVHRYEPAIRMEVRMRLSDRRLTRAFDSMDICQSVLASFFLRAATGQYDLEEPTQLVRLLVGMARNKLAFHVRKQRAQCRDHRRNEGIDHDGFEPASPYPTPSRIAAGKELLGEFQRRLSPDERRLADRRAQGQQWNDIAAELGGTAQGRRKQLARALDRVTQELGLEENDDE